LNPTNYGSVHTEPPNIFIAMIPVSLYSYSDRDFHAFYGVSKLTAAFLLSHLILYAPEFEFTLAHVLWALFFLKNYAVDDVASKIFAVSHTTYRLWVWRVLYSICRTLHTVIHSFASLIF
jgi:hypothetical protein